MCTNFENNALKIAVAKEDRSNPFGCAFLLRSSRHALTAGPETRIYTIRGQKVMLDSDLAELYGVETKALKRAVRRNIDRFPDDFMFELTKEEAEESRRQNGTLNSSRGHNIKYLPYAFTEQGLAMLSGVIRCFKQSDCS